MALSGSQTRGSPSLNENFLDITHFQSTDNSRLEDSRVVRSLELDSSSSQALVETQTVNPSRSPSPFSSETADAEADVLKNLLKTTAASRKKSNNKNNSNKNSNAKKDEDPKDKSGKKVTHALQRIWSAGKLFVKKGKYKKKSDEAQQIFVREYDATNASVIKFNRCQRAQKQLQAKSASSIKNNNNLRHAGNMVDIIRSSSSSDNGRDPPDSMFTDVLTNVGSCGTTVDTYCQCMFPTPTTVSYNQLQRANCSCCRK